MSGQKRSAVGNRWTHDSHSKGFYSLNTETATKWNEMKPHILVSTLEWLPGPDKSCVISHGLPALSLSLSLSLRSTFANIIVFSIYVLLSKIHLQLGPWMVNSLHFVFYYLRITCKNILVWNFVDGCKFHYLLEGMMGGFDILTRHFSHQAFTDENEWCSLKEVAFGIDYIVQFLLLLFMSFIVLFSIILKFYSTN